MACLFLETGIAVYLLEYSGWLWSLGKPALPTNPWVSTTYPLSPYHFMLYFTITVNFMYNNYTILYFSSYFAIRKQRHFFRHSYLQYMKIFNCSQPRRKLLYLKQKLYTCQFFIELQFRKTKFFCVLSFLSGASRNFYIFQLFYFAVLCEYAK